MTEDQLCRIFQKNLRRLREELGFSKSELARRLDVSPGYVCDFEHGRRNPTLRSLARLANALGVSPVSLVSGVPNRRKNHRKKT